MATLLATVVAMEAGATDDAVKLFDVLTTWAPVRLVGKVCRYAADAGHEQVDQDHVEPFALGNSQ